MQGKVEISGVNTAKLKTLSNQEMMDLIRRAQAGDEQARGRLVEGNLKLVLSVIQRFLGRGENPDDLFQVGCIGLLKAIANFDTTKDVRFSTYGVPMIAGELRRYLRDYSPIRISRSMRDMAYKVLQCKEALTGKNGREPTNSEIAQALGVPLGEVEKIPTSAGSRALPCGRPSMRSAHGKSASLRSGFMTARRRWRWRARSASRRRRSRGWKKTRSAPSGAPSARHEPARRCIGCREPEWEAREMLNRFSELRNKEIIHVCEGCRLGYMHDLTIELETGRIVNIIVPGPCRFLGLFGRQDDYVIPWCCIRRIGEDIILVDGPVTEWRTPRKRKWLF